MKKTIHRKPSSVTGDRINPLFNQKDSFRLFDYCKLNGYGILGIEGFDFSDNSRILNMNAIVDFSELLKIDPSGFKDKSIEIAKGFLCDFIETGIELEFCLIKLDTK